MRNNSFTTLSIIAITIAAFAVSSCQKDDVLKSEKQIEKSDGIQTSQNNVAPDNLPRPDNAGSKTRGLNGELLMYSSNFKKIHFSKDNGKRILSVEMARLATIPDLDPTKPYYIEIWDYALERDWIFFKTWHKKHVCTMLIDEYLKAKTEIDADDLFAGIGTGHRELWIYLTRKYLGVSIYKTLFIKYYSEIEKKDFDNWTQSN